MSKIVPIVVILLLFIGITIWLSSERKAPVPEAPTSQSNLANVEESASAKPETYAKRVEKRISGAMQSAPKEGPGLTAAELQNAPQTMTGLGPSVFSQAKQKYIDKRLSEISQFVTIDDSNRNELHSLFQGEWELKLNSFGPLYAPRADSELKEGLALVIGSDAAEKYFADREQQEQEESHRQLASRVTVLSQSLDLSIEQEKEVTDALQSIDQVAKAQLAEALANSENPDNPNEAIRQYQAVSQQNRLELQDRLRDILTKEQYQRYLAVEAERKPLTPGANPFR